MDGAKRAVHNIYDTIATNELRRKYRRMINAVRSNTYRGNTTKRNGARSYLKTRRVAIKNADANNGEGELINQLLRNINALNAAAGADTATGAGAGADVGTGKKLGVTNSTLRNRERFARMSAVTEREYTDAAAGGAGAAAPAPAPVAAAIDSRYTSWYRILEISREDFLKCCSDLYKVLEKRHVSVSSEDPFLKAIIQGHSKMSDEEWLAADKARLFQKILEMKMGDFHEELMGKFHGWKTLKNGHPTGMDVSNEDGTIMLEVKNRNNTVKASDGKHTIEKIERLKREKDIRAIFVQVNCPGGKVSRYTASASVDIMNGHQIYTFLSGRSTFFNDLLLTLKFVFANYNTFEELKRGLGIR